MNKRICKKKRKQFDEFFEGVDLNKLAKAQFDINQRILDYSMHQMALDESKEIKGLI